VVAQTVGGDQDNVLHVGAHSDSVEAGPGINDNGSGTIGILEVAVQLAKFTVNNAVRFSWWSAEEEGLLGAEAYVTSLPQSELDKIRLYLNFDMIASPNFYYGIYDGDGSTFGISGAPGSAEAEKLFEDFFHIDEDLPHAPSEFNGRSDYGPFLDAGIPCGGLDTGAEGIKTEEEAAIFGGTAGIGKGFLQSRCRQMVANPEQHMIPTITVQETPVNVLLI
jgi:carboxypeptidase Q